MPQPTFFTPYSEVCETFASALGDWFLWGERTPVQGSPALLDWDRDIDTMPWTPSGLEECDRHGLQLFDAAFRVFEYVTANGSESKDYLAFAAGLRSCVEASALARWLIDKDLTSIDRLTRLGNLALSDLHHMRAAASNRARGVGLSRDALRRPEWAQAQVDIVETLSRLRGDLPVYDKDLPPRFGAYVSITKQVVSLLANADSATANADMARADYAMLSAPSHASFLTIRLLYEPTLQLGHLGRRRVQPPHEVIGHMLWCAGLALVHAHVALARRLGWSVDPDLADLLTPILKVMKLENGTDG